MIKILKYLKEYTPSVILIFIILILQAACDLTLPQYTSDIVNIGIQQGGIEEAAPNVIRKSTMEKVVLFLNEEDSDFILQQYKLLEKKDFEDAQWQKVRKRYPVLAEEPVYELKKVEKEIKEDLNSKMSKALMQVMSFNSGSKEAAAMEAEMKQNLPEEMQELDIFTIISMMPDEQRNQLMAEMNKNFQQMPESIIEQSAIAATKSEYMAIGIDVEKIQTEYILVTGAKMIGLTLVVMAATISVGYMASKVAAAVARKLRNMVFGKVVSFSNAEFDKYSTSTLITRSTNDIQQIQMLVVMLLRIILYAPIMGIGGVFKVFRTNTSMAWIIGVAVGLIFLVVFVLFSVVMPKFKLMQKLVDRLNLVTREILTGLPVIRAFSTEKHEEKRFDDANKDLTRANLFVNRAMTCMMPIMMFISNAIAVLIVWNGASGVNNGSMQVGDLMAFIQYTMQIIMAFLMISMVSIMLPRASVAGTRIAEVLETPVSILEPKQPAKAEASRKGYVEYQHVNFRYPGAEEDVLSDITFTARPGETTAIIGSTGSGKSTLINLLPRFYDVTEGSILLDGVNIKNLAQHDLRGKLGVVPQKGILFSGTIDSNLRYGKEDAKQEELKKAARISQAEDFIEEKPDRYETPIAQGGSNVSGGQKQRLSIARAIVKNPEVYVFDDSFSALDYKTDITLRKALKRETSESTVIIVAQRISTIMNAEQILVLDDGKIVGKGTHKELLANCDVYKQIALSQLSEKELEESGSVIPGKED